jgi:leucine dehydrogenase
MKAEHAWSQPDGFANHAKASMITPLLPNTTQSSSQVLRKSLPDLGVELMVGVAVPITNARPGNGGFRIWNYDSGNDAASEAIALAQGMEVKHSAYNTGFAGAKVVCDARGGNIADVDKPALLDAAADLLHELNGTMYTGCDLNTTSKDMNNLAQKSPYVLAAIGNVKTNPDDATAFGVLGALQACVGSNLAGKSFLVHGCGGVGGTVAFELVRAGADVYTLDVVPERANVFGATNISKGTNDEVEEWWRMDVDVLVPCSASGLINATKAEQLSCKTICGATNLPFSSYKIQELCEQRGILFVPEGIASAGAVIVDSVEHFDTQAFEASSPSDLYEFCRNTVEEKTTELLNLADSQSITAASATPQVMDETSKSNDHRIGKTFRHWQKGRRSMMSRVLSSCVDDA